MKINKLFLSSLFFLSSSLWANSHDRIVANIGEISLKPNSQKGNNALVYNSIYIPPICQSQKCEGTASIVMFNGKQLDIKSGPAFFSSVVDGLDFELRISDDSVVSLMSGQGGTIEITIQQGIKPYLSGGFNVPFMSYIFKDKEGTELTKVNIDVKGNVKSGICSILTGSNINFNLNSTINEIKKQKETRKLVDIKNIEFDCVNVSSMILRFSSSDVDPRNPEVLKDYRTGFSTILEYDASGKRSNIYWDDSKNIFQVNDDKVSILLRLYVVGASVIPGQFSINGVYNIEYN